MQEEFDAIIADLNRYSRTQRQVAMLAQFAAFIEFGGEKAAQLEEAGYHEQAVELRRRLAELMPDATDIPPLALPQPQPASLPSTNGAPSLPTKRRGRPPKGTSS